VEPVVVRLAHGVEHPDGALERLRIEDLDEGLGLREGQRRGHAPDREPLAFVLDLLFEK